MAKRNSRDFAKRGALNSTQIQSLLIKASTPDPDAAAKLITLRERQQKEEGRIVTEKHLEKEWNVNPRSAKALNDHPWLVTLLMPVKYESIKSNIDLKIEPWFDGKDPVKIRMLGLRHPNKHDLLEIRVNSDGAYELVKSPKQEMLVNALKGLVRDLGELASQPPSPLGKAEIKDSFPLNR